MKMMHEHINFPGRCAIRIKKQEVSQITYPWHFHSEYEIFYVVEGKGTGFVADSIEPFATGDMVMLGSNLPHFWKNDETYERSDCNEKLKYIIIQFPFDFFDAQISTYPEFRLIGELLKRSSRGLQFPPEVSRQFSSSLLKLTEESGIERIILFLDFLNKLGKVKDYNLLAGEYYQKDNFDFGNDRLTSVLHHISTNYLQKIELEKVAEIAHLHPSAFCRFFREKTGKSLFEYVNDMRVSYACKLIIERTKTISQVCFEAGFNNLSNFNRTFKKQTGYTPSEYYREFNKR
ncbi:helix-turn-helix domain-containing protein [Maribellus comscasis]|uniref:Helix-turn-helix domain-containing protein n=1 Tax=Maribellus comscasis TaxID=2681766 RepID=A0A6I6JLA7_9BACT|nr:AraC family transcriptional regulator [Maribellus comscasis]QGY43635.1 helix-turn-helix domain-containing protein [Maribellus comscasis]